MSGARTSATSPMDLALFLEDVAKRLGGFTPVSPIEKFIEALPATKRTIPPDSLAATKYSGGRCQTDAGTWTLKKS